MLRDVESQLRDRLREACDAEASGISTESTAEIRRLEDSLLAAAVAQSRPSRYVTTSSDGDQKRLRRLSNPGSTQDTNVHNVVRCSPAAQRASRPSGFLDLGPRVWQATAAQGSGRRSLRSWYKNGTGTERGPQPRALGAFRKSLRRNGRGGIRTHGTLLTYTSFPGLRLKPLGHPSNSGVS